jgi:hypothetical protein
MSRRFVGRTFVLSWLGAVGCGSSDGSGNPSADEGIPGATPVSPATSASYEGSYALSSFTVNPTGCDVEGPAETSAHKPTFVMAAGAGPEPSPLALVACAGDVECAEKVALVRAGGAISAEYAVFLREEDGANVLRGGAFGPGSHVEGVCVGRKWLATVITREGDSVRGETRTIPLSDAPSAAGSCISKTASELAREAEGRACSELRVIEGQKIGPLPG